MKRVLIVGAKYSHMGSHSGYGGIVKELMKSDEVKMHFQRRFTNNHLFQLFFWFAKKIFRPLKQRTPFYKAPALITELVVILRCLIFRYSTVHYLAIEDNYCLLKSKKVRYLLNNKLTVLATIHQPISWWKVSADIRLLRDFDILITLTTFDQKQFSKELGREVMFIPHPVDIEFFRPHDQHEVSKNFTCLFVGNWLRDIELLSEIIEESLSKDPTIKFNIVYPLSRQSSNWKLYRMSRHEQVTFYVGVSNDKLRKLYQESDLLVLPLIDCTANNSILEAMACGLPIVVSDLMGVRSYVDDSFSSRVLNTPTSFCDEILAQKRQKSLDGIKGRAHAEKYLAHPVVARQFISHYLDDLSQLS